MNTKRYFLVCGIIILAVLAAGMVLYPRLPERVPSHWSIHGNVNGYMKPTRAVFFYPAVMTGTMILFALLPAISPRHFEVDSFRSTYLYIMMLVVATLGYFQGIVLWAAVTSSARLPVNRAIIGGVCLLLVLQGNVLSKVRRNFFIGVRTPWTLASEPVWYATHRLAAKVFVAVGALGLVLAFVLANPMNVVFIVIVGGMIPVVYSFIYYKHLERQGANL